MGGSGAYHIYVSSQALTHFQRCAPHLWTRAVKERDLHTFAGRYLQSSLDVYWLPLRVDYGDGETTERFPVFLPHELFAMLAELKETCGKCCLPSEGAGFLGFCFQPSLHSSSGRLEGRKHCIFHVCNAEHQRLTRRARLYVKRIPQY